MKLALNILRGPILFLALLPFIPAGFAAESASGSLEIEEIVVTARKIEENLRDVPATVNALTAEALDERGIASLQDIADATPGFDFASAFGRTDFRPVIRGQANVLGRANAGLFVDGIIIEEGNASIPLAALERVEVVKGPQSALYGRSTLAGAVNYVLKGPGDTFEGEVSAELGERDYSRVELHASGPLSDMVGAAVTFSHYERGGEYDNNSPGSDIDDKVGDEETTSFTGVITLTPSDQFSVRLHGIYEDSDDAHYAIGMLPSTYNNCFRVPQDTMQPAPPAGTPEASANFGRSGPTGAGYGGSGYYCGKVDVGTVLGEDDGRDATTLRTGFFPSENFPPAGSERESLRLGLRMDWDLNESMSLTSITGYNDVDWFGSQDQSFGGGGAFGPVFGFVTMENDDFEDFSQELRLRGEQGGNLRYMAGVYYYDSKESGDIVGSGRADAARRADPANNPPRDDGSSSIDSISFFGSVEYDVSEQMTLGLEMRYNEDEFDITPAGASDAVSDKFDAFLPKFTLSYKASDDMLIYGNVAVGNKPGTLNSSLGIPDSVRPVDEETAVSYEVGLKNQWMDGRVESNVAIYHITWEDMQLTSTRAFDNPDGTVTSTSILENVGEASITGLEFELAMALTEFWDARITYAYTDSDIDEFVQSVDAGGTVENGFREAALIGGYSASGDVIISGTSLPHTSKHQASLSSRFHGRIDADWGWFLRADWNHNSKRYAQVYNLAHTGSRDILNLRAGIEGDRLSIDLWLDNALDDESAPALIRYVNIIPRPPFVLRGIGATLPERRRFGVTLRARF
ncbi:MAG: TonB-dependent receptor [Gammaproteobacteria bacterium]|nr:TonB-dependent receptor [Gammaproteobacteria bacterium]